MSRSYLPATPWKKLTRRAQRRRRAVAHGSALRYTSNRRHSTSRWVRKRSRRDERPNAIRILSGEEHFDVGLVLQRLVHRGQDRLRHRRAQLDEHAADAAEPSDRVIHRVQRAGEAADHGLRHPDVEMALACARRVRRCDAFARFHVEDVRRNRAGSRTRRCSARSHSSARRRRRASPCTARGGSRRRVSAIPRSAGSSMPSMSILIRSGAAAGGWRCRYRASRPAR